MADEFMAAGIGVFATLAGVITEQLLSSRRETRASRSRFREALSAVIADLQNTLAGFRRSKTYLPSLGSIEALKSSGLLRELSPQLAADLMNCGLALELIKQASTLHHQSCLATMANPRSEWDLRATAEERNSLIEEQVKILPMIITKLEDALSAQ
jgi:hypothetical protein